jgi:hypothetical protein
MTARPFPTQTPWFHNAIGEWHSKMMTCLLPSLLDETLFGERERERLGLNRSWERGTWSHVLAAASPHDLPSFCLRLQRARSNFPISLLFIPGILNYCSFQLEMLSPRIPRYAPTLRFPLLYIFKLRFFNKGNYRSFIKTVPSVMTLYAASVV